MKTTDQGNLRTLWTARGKALADDPSRPVGTTHPRPLLKRPAILLLNGWWDFEGGTEGVWATVHGVPKELDMA